MLTHLQHWQRINICHNALLQVLTRRGGHANMYGKLLSNMLFSPFFCLVLLFFLSPSGWIVSSCLTVCFKRARSYMGVKSWCSWRAVLKLRQCSVTRFTALHQLALRDYHAVCITECLDTKRTTAYLACGLYLFSTAEEFWTKKCIWGKKNWEIDGAEKVVKALKNLVPC